MKRKIFSLLLCGTFVFSLLSCDGKNKKQEGAGGGGAADVTVWTATGMEKICQDLDYSASFSSKTLEISAFRNENEAGQIILTLDNQAKANVKEYTIKLNDLSDGDGNVLPSSSFTVYNQKYVYVDEIWNSKSDLSRAYYPDALLPFEAAVAYDENKITWREDQEYANQGVWVVVKPEKTQAAGTYEGKFAVTVDGKLYHVPVRVRVYDYTIGDYTHTKSSFALSNDDIVFAEQDASKEMIMAYNDFLMDYRLNAQNMPDLPAGAEMGKDDVMQTYLDGAVRLAMDKRCTSFNIPYKSVGRTYYVVKKNNVLEKLFTLDASGDVDFSLCRNDDEPLTDEEVKKAIADKSSVSQGSVDFDLYAKTLLLSAKRSVEESLKNLSEDTVQEPVNIMAKIATYMLFFDECDQNKTEPAANYCLEMSWRKNNEVAEQLKTELTCSAEEAAAFEDKYGISFEDYKEQLIHDTANIKNKIVCNSTASIITKHGCFVPNIDRYDNEEAVEIFKEFDLNSYGEGNGELWTYTCTAPKYPYSTYHIDDYLVSARLLYWMMYEYNIVGNLYWMTNLYTYRTQNDSNLDKYLVNYYETPLHFPMANGDGFLVYPGREYGIFGPVGTIRLHAVRDGIEDYDLLYELEEYYKERGIDGDKFNSVYEMLNRELYKGSRVNHSSELVGQLLNSRQLLGSLLELAANHGVIIENVESKRGVTTVHVSAPADVTVKKDGQTQSGTADGELVYYAIEIATDNTENTVTLAFEKANANYEMTFDLGGKNVIISADKLEISFNKNYGKNDTFSLSQRDREIEGVVEQEKTAVLSFADKTSLKLGRHDVEIKMGAFGLTEATGAILVNIYYDGTEDIEVTTNAKTQSMGSGQDLQTYTLSHGWNQIKISTAKLTYAEDTTNLDYIKLIFKAETLAPLTVELGSIEVEG